MLDSDADHEHENAYTGHLELSPHPMRLAYPDPQREQHVDASDRLEGFGKEEHSDVVSDVYPRRHEDVLDVECVAQCHFHDDAQHCDEQKSRDAEAHRPPCFKDLLASARE